MAGYRKKEFEWEKKIKSFFICKYFRGGEGFSSTNKQRTLLYVRVWRKYCANSTTPHKSTRRQRKMYKKGKSTVDYIFQEILMYWGKFRWFCGNPRAHSLFHVNKKLFRWHFLSWKHNLKCIATWTSFFARGWFDYEE